MTEVQAADFCCVPIAGETGELIALGEKFNRDKFTRYQHAEIYIPADAVPRGTPEALAVMQGKAPFGFTFGAYPDGAAFISLPGPPDGIQNALWSSGAIPLTTAQRKYIITMCYSLKGTPYSFLDYFALAAHRLHIPVPGLKSFISSSHHLICSQLVDEVYTRAGLTLFTDDRWSGYVTPADLASAIERGREKQLTV